MRAHANERAFPAGGPLRSDGQRMAGLAGPGRQGVCLLRLLGLAVMAMAHPFTGPCT